MEILTFEDDLLELKEFAERLEIFINVEHQYVEGGLVVGLSSKFGTGKSTFLKMWKSSMQEKEDDNIAILLNAWESDYYGDPLFAIISTLVENIKEKGKSADKIISAAKDIGCFSAAIGSQIVKNFTGIDTFEVGELAEKKKKGRDKDLFPDTFSIYEDRKNAMNSLKEAIQDFIEKNKLRVLFLVDELDRCRPDYAISYLETIKHIFDIKGTAFLLAADRKHLENSTRTAFGAKLDFEEYYRKFVHREVTLPDISDVSYEKIASKYVKFYLESDGTRNCFMELDRYRIKNIVELVGAFKLTPRQIQEVFRTLGHIFETTEDNKGNMLWCLAVGTILMSVLKIVNSEIYDLLKTQKLPPQKALDLFKNKLHQSSYADWWFTLCLTGGGIENKNNETRDVVMENLGLETRDLSQWDRDWGWGRSSSNRFEQISKKIKELEKWS